MIGIVVAAVPGVIVATGAARRKTSATDRLFGP
jgi:hypothetical protein